MRLTEPQRRAMEFLQRCEMASTGKVGDSLYSRWGTYRQRRAWAEKVVTSLAKKGLIRHGPSGWVLTEMGQESLAG